MPVMAAPYELANSPLIVKFTQPADHAAASLWQRYARRQMYRDAPPDTSDDDLIYEAADQRFNFDRHQQN